MAVNEVEKVIKVPRFKKENGFYTTAQRSALMSKIKGKNTSPELLFRKALWQLGLRYRLHNKTLPGNPDVVIKKHKVVIFIDGEFWHGYNWEQKKLKIKANHEFWVPKIERNMQRDAENNVKLESLGYKVFRFWEKTINTDLNTCVSEVSAFLDLN